VYIHSEMACREICDKLDFENVSVNYMTAAAPYVQYAEDIVKSSLEIPRSICIGVRRLMLIRDSENEIRLEAVGGIVQHPPGTKEPVATVGVYCDRLSVRLSPESVACVDHQRVSSNLSNVLGPHELRTLKWVVGNGPLDPVEKPGILYLYGRGGNG